MRNGFLKDASFDPHSNFYKFILLLEFYQVRQFKDYRFLLMLTSFVLVGSRVFSDSSHCRFRPQIRKVCDFEVRNTLDSEYIFINTGDDLKELFFIATSQTHFVFDGSFYDQIDGLSMGSPLAPVLANLFMGHHEMNWLDTSPSEILFYRRHVDETFCLFRTESDTLLFFLFRQLPSLQHTVHNGSGIRS